MNKIILHVCRLLNEHSDKNNMKKIFLHLEYRCRSLFFKQEKTCHVLHNMDYISYYYLLLSLQLISQAIYGWTTVGQTRTAVHILCVICFLSTYFLQSQANIMVMCVFSSTRNAALSSKLLLMLRQIARKYLPKCWQNPFKCPANAGK